MRLRALHLHGFKSFADRTTLEFRDGVTAIVGSNGCGKSNIADSIRWVLGEQRASAVRGAKMEEVIFQGTTRRRPLNFAEVSLHFDNDRGRVSVPQSEIEVARKVFREGGSEYALNRNPCRLRDIHNLLRDTGLGSNAYAVIEAGMIETLLSDRAEERRMLFEEAAGIGRYKDSRQAATRRLESAEGDLARLEDLVAEVESKVRSLGRQRRRAERYTELRTQRLELEVWLAQAELQSLEESLERAGARRAELETGERTAAASRGTSELRAEERRLELAALGERRARAAARVDEVRRELDARERERLVAHERASHAELRVAQLAGERMEVEERWRALGAQMEELRAELQRHSGVLEGLRATLESRAEESALVRSALIRERAATEGAAARARELTREIASVEGERGVLDRRARELELRAAESEVEGGRLQQELDRLAEQGEAWETRAAEARERTLAAAEQVELAREEVRVLSAQEHAAREPLRAEETRLSRLTALLEAREAVERSYAGFAPAVAALMGGRDRFPGVRGPLADFVERDPREAAALEAYLGPALQAVVVADLATARAVRAWFHDEWDGGGSLLLLPLDVAGAADPRAWLDRFLEGVVLGGDDPLASHAPGVARVGPSGEVVDARGMIRLSARGAGDGILARRDELSRLREEREEAARAVDGAAAAREGRLAALEYAEAHARQLDEVRRAAEAELHAVQADAASHGHHLARLRRDRDQLAQGLVAIHEAARQATERARELEARFGELERGVAEASAAEESARARLAELEARWEEARDEESELRVAVARAEGELRETERRLAGAEQGSAGAAARLQAIDREGTELRAALQGLSGVRERTGVEIDALFAARDREAAELAALEQRLAALDAELAVLGEEARTARRRETESAEERHQLELHLAELRSRAERVVERLEVEWARPWEVLRAGVRPAERGAVEEWRAALRDAHAQLEALGPVNMLALEEHAEEEARLNFLLEQRADLVKARDDLVAAIRQINRTAREVFLSTFETVRTNFHRVFQSLFQGGECDIWLADPDDPLESPVEIQASPVGKRTQRIHLLSGGERTLTALALLFALYLVKPSPFCVLDEVDAPLDESNVGRFIQLLQDFKADTQFVVITHNPRTMEAADWVYGVTMEDPGVSSIVGVELLGDWHQGERDAAAV